MGRPDITETVFFQTDLRCSTLGGWNLRRVDLRGIIADGSQIRDLPAEIGILVID